VKEQDEIATTNRHHWEKMVRERCEFTRPWLNLDRALLRQYAQGELASAPEPLTEIYPASVLTNVSGKEVLCLASGGGQQSAVFALLGAKVTVVDMTDGQLDGDRQAAAHYGYKVTTIRADMRDLSGIGDESFDLIYQAPSMAYVPDVRQVYREVGRLLRPAGVYRVEYTNPATEFVDYEDWDGEGYRITRPYTERVRHRSDGALEFRHYLRDIFNGLIAAGLSIEHVEEAQYYRQQPADIQPGSWQHWTTYVTGFAIVAKMR
jgi:2-polyprenyl-3-methyl-5-hydroxy-6-metoxy-1,4-benzoquinol methylase